MVNRYNVVRRVINLLNFIVKYFPLSAAIALFLISLLFQPTHDWDLDAFLYLGSRLNHGELIYIKDFETKLPGLQYIFYFPAMFGGIGAWRIISFIIALIASYISTRLLLADFYYGLASRNPYKRLGFFFIGLFLLFLYSLPGSSSSHIEIAASSFLYLSLTLVLIQKLSYGYSRKLMFIAGCLLAGAALIRPNYVYLLPLYITLGVLKDKKLCLERFKLPLTFSLLLGFSVVIFLVFLPYYFTDGGTAALLNGLQAMKNASHDYGLLHLLSEELLHKPGIFYFLMYCSVILLGILFFKSSENGQGKWMIAHYGLPILASILLLNMSLLRNHYYPHNTLMFVPFLSVLLLIFTVLKVEKTFRNFDQKFGLIAFIFFIYLLMRPAADLLKGVTKIFDGRYVFNAQINHRNVDDVLLNFLKNQKKNGKTFLVADNASYHMILDEKRVGDGHPIILEIVLGGGHFVSMQNIFLLSEAGYKHPCSALTKSNKDYIVVKRDDQFYKLVNNCLTGKSSGYIEINEAGLLSYAVYRKNL